MRRRADRRPLPPALAGRRAAPRAVITRTDAHDAPPGATPPAAHGRTRAPPCGAVRGRRLRRRAGGAGRPGPLAPAAVWRLRRRTGPAVLRDEPAVRTQPGTCSRDRQPARPPADHARAALRLQPAPAGGAGLSELRGHRGPAVSAPCALQDRRSRPAGVHRCGRHAGATHGGRQPDDGRAQRCGIGEPADVEPAAQRAVPRVRRAAAARWLPGHRLRPEHVVQLPRGPAADRRTAVAPPATGTPPRFASAGPRAPPRAGPGPRPRRPRPRRGGAAQRRECHPTHPCRPRRARSSPRS